MKLWWGKWNNARATLSLAQNMHSNVSRYQLLSFRSSFTCRIPELCILYSLNFFTFYLVLNPLNSNFCPPYTTEIGMVVAEFTFFDFSAAYGNFDYCFHLKPSPWLVKLNTSAAHRSLALLSPLWHAASAHYLNSVLHLPFIRHRHFLVNLNYFHGFQLMATKTFIFSFDYFFLTSPFLKTLQWYPILMLRIN